MSMHPPAFDAVYVVSDLHLGGERNDDENFQIFAQGPRLARFIDHVATDRPDGEVALVLNGDVIDSLAEDDVKGYVALGAGTAVRMMERLYADDSFKMVWAALAAFVRTERRHLVFVVGNHDIELALPAVETSLRARLAGDDGEARARVHLSSHGGGFACRVGESRVFCTHGNELDPWNWVDHNALAQLANAQNAGRRVTSKLWKPNAGTRLVCDVMNQVKRVYPFVDLLKPEGAAVAAVLTALDRDQMRGIDWSDALPVLRDRRRGEKVTSRLLGAEFAPSPDDPEPTPRDAAEQLLGANVRQALERRLHASVTEDELLRRAERQELADAELREDGGAGDTLGAGDLVASWFGLIDEEEGLRCALRDWLDGDRTFAIEDREDELFRAMEGRVGGDVDFVVTGHTHQARAMTWSSGCHYYNCGTWIRTLRLTKEVLDDEDAFKRRLWPALTKGKMTALDAAMIPGPEGADVPLLFDRTHAVRIERDGDAAAGDLLRVDDDGDGLDLVREATTKRGR